MTISKARQEARKAASRAAKEEAHARRENMLEDIEWLLDQGANRFDLERAFPRVTIDSMERAAYRSGNKELAARIHRALAESRVAA